MAAGERQAVVLAGVTSCLVLRPGASASTCCLHVRVSDQGLEPGWEIRKQEVTGTRDPSNLNLCFPYPQSLRLPGLPSVSCCSPSAGDHTQPSVVAYVGTEPHARWDAGSLRATGNPPLPCLYHPVPQTAPRRAVSARTEGRQTHAGTGRSKAQGKGPGCWSRGSQDRASVSLVPIQ